MNHYTYVIRNKINNMCYIGKRSCKCHPCDDIKYWSSSKNKEFKKELKEFPERFIKTIIMLHETKEEALAMEIHLHNKFDVGRNPKYYNLAKQTSTGFDVTGCIGSNLGKPMSEITKQKLREINTGKSMSDNWKQKISSVNIGNKYKLGKSNSKNQIKMLIKRNNKKVVCIETGEIFDSAKDASIFLGLNKNAISNSITKNCKCKKFTWRYI